MMVAKKERIRAFCLPSKDSPQWRLWVKGKLLHNYQNIVLQMKVNYIVSEVEANRMAVVFAIDELYNTCLKYKIAVFDDLETIFCESINFSKN